MSIVSGRYVRNQCMRSNLELFVRELQKKRRLGKCVNRFLQLLLLPCALGLPVCILLFRVGALEAAHRAWEQARCERRETRIWTAVARLALRPRRSIATVAISSERARVPGTAESQRLSGCFYLVRAGESRSPARQKQNSNPSPSMSSSPVQYAVLPPTPTSASALPVIGMLSGASAANSSSASSAASSHLEESALLYHKTVPVRVQSAQRDTASVELCVSIVLRTVHSHQKQQALLFQITDEVRRGVLLLRVHVDIVGISSGPKHTRTLTNFASPERPILSATTRGD